MKAILLIVRRSLRQHLASTLITALCVALATGLIMAVFAINTQTKKAFTGGPVGFDAVLGARGSQLQLVLNTVFHLETSPGNLPWSMYQAIQKERGVTLAVPYAVGDNHKGFRIVGTTEEMFTEFEYQKGRKFEMAQGHVFDVSRQEAVVGSFVADKLGLEVGDIFQPTHGLTDDEHAHSHSEEYIITGVMAPSNSPSDRVIWIPIEGIFRMGGHVLRGSGEAFEAERGQAIPDEHKEVSAVMIKFRAPQFGMRLQQTINNQGKVATLAYPIGNVMASLFEKMGWVHRVLTLVAYLVVVVAAASIFAGIYNTINERRREFAILRALGARSRMIFSAIITETAAIAVLGVIAGFAVYAVILFTAGRIIRSTTGVVIDLAAWDPVLVYAPLGIVLLGAVAGVFPAIKAYRTDVAENIVPSS